ncbi:MAG: hypothetical protein LBB73_06510 [Dysgonamonadaceae bacterium]|jgi:intein-encoded DNA endonuclease-like protein|nr:hypothetical protein [Dysgonamonadaceae bacterium]
METIVVRVNNKQAFKLFKNLEALNVIKVLRHIPCSQVNTIIKNNTITNRDKRLSEIQSVTKNINIDLTNFHFNRDDANNYD